MTLYSELKALQDEARDYLVWDRDPNVKRELHPDDRRAVHFKFMVSLAAGLIALDLSELESDHIGAYNYFTVDSAPVRRWHRGPFWINVWPGKWSLWITAHRCFTASWYRSGGPSRHLSFEVSTFRV